MSFIQADTAPARGLTGILSASSSISRFRVEALIVAIAAGVAATAVIAHELAPSRPISGSSDATVGPISPTAQSGTSVGRQWAQTSARSQGVTGPSEGLSTRFASAALAPPFHFGGSDLERGRAVDCLAAVAWYEAGNDPVGQRSVMQVVLNRLKHPSFPKSICGVVFQGSERRTGCQFTFTCDGSMRRRIPSLTAWARSKALAQRALDGEVDKSVFQATHYHADYVVPWWSAKLHKLAQVGAHIFYSWPGQRGALSRSNVFAYEGNIVALQGLAGKAILPLPEVAPHRAGLAMSRATSVELAQRGSLSKPPTVFAQMVNDQTAMVQVDGTSQSGRWALQALKTCAGRASCQVIGYDSAIALDENRARSPENRDRPVFLFVRDVSSGMDLTLWDCDRVERPSAKQCLPVNGPALRNLLRSR